MLSSVMTKASSTEVTIEMRPSRAPKMRNCPVLAPDTYVSARSRRRPRAVIISPEIAPTKAMMSAGPSMAIRFVSMCGFTFMEWPLLAKFLRLSVSVCNTPEKVMSNDKPAVMGMMVAFCRWILPTACCLASFQVLNGRGRRCVHPLVNQCMT